jgi:hypothetical protein
VEKSTFCDLERSFFSFVFHAVCEIMLKNMVESDRRQETI